MRAPLAPLAVVAALACHTAAAAPPHLDARLPRLGVLADAGLPGGLGVGLQVRPIPWLRLDAGPMWSGIGVGVKGGAILAPWARRVSPTLELEAGSGLRADLSFLARRGDVPDGLKPVLAHASYHYVAGLLGVDLGAPGRLAFFVRAGLARLEARAPRTGTTATADGGTLELGDVVVRANIPCAKFGLQWWF